MRKRRTRTHCWSWIVECVEALTLPASVDAAKRGKKQSNWRALTHILESKLSSYIAINFVQQLPVNFFSLIICLFPLLFSTSWLVKRILWGKHDLWRLLLGLPERVVQFLRVTCMLTRFLSFIFDGFSEILFRSPTITCARIATFHEMLFRQRSVWDYANET